MITIQNPLTFTSSYPPKRLGAISDLLFFDIETTGFSGDYASVYLIGCVWHDGNTSLARPIQHLQIIFQIHRRCQIRIVADALAFIRAERQDDRFRQAAEG